MTPIPPGSNLTDIVRSLCDSLTAAPAAWIYTTTVDEDIQLSDASFAELYVNSMGPAIIEAGDHFRVLIVPHSKTLKEAVEACCYEFTNEEQSALIKKAIEEFLQVEFTSSFIKQLDDNFTAASEGRWGTGQ